MNVPIAKSVYNRYLQKKIFTKAEIQTQMLSYLGGIPQSPLQFFNY